MERSLDARTSGASTPFAEPGATPRYAPSRRFRILHADVALHIDPEARSYQGVTTFRVEAQAAFDGVLRFDLEGVEVLGVEDADGQALPYELEDAAIAVRAAVEVVTLRYRGGRPAAGLYFVGPNADAPDREPSAWTQCQDEDAHFFMPCHDHPRVRHPWSVTLRGPAGYTLLSNGRRVAEGEDEQGAWARFEQAEPMPSYLFTAVVARLDVVEDEVDGVALRFLVPPGTTEAGMRSMGRTGDMVRLLATRTGVPYPWPRYDQVVVWDFSFGGMENTACTTMTDALLLDDRSGPHWPAEGLVVHELAHQWFGDLVTCTDWSQAWLNESFATFCEVVWWEEVHEPAEATWYAWQQLNDYLEEDRGRYRRPIAELSYREPIDVFDRHLYEKGSLVLRTLRTTLGEAAFWRGVQLYLTRHAHSSVHTLDLRRAMEEVSGLDLGAFFDTWINRGGHPVLDVKLGEEAGLVTVTVRQRQEGAPEVYELPLRLELIGDDGVIAAIDLPVRERERTWALPVTGAVRAVRVDPGFRVLADLTLDAPQPWLLRLAGDTCPVVAARAVRALATRGTPAAWDGVVGALATHPHWGVRAEAAAALGRRGGERARDVLIEAILGETEPRARAAVATALGGFVSGEAADALITASRRTSTWTEQGTILHAIGRTRDPRAVLVLDGALGPRGWADALIQRVLAGLGATEELRVLPTLLAHARPDRAERVAAGAAAALGTLGAAVEEARRPCREALEQVLLHGRYRARTAAAQALGRIKDPAACGALEQAWRTDPDGRVRRLAWEALQATRAGRTSDEAVGALRAKVDALAAENDRLRARVDRLEKGGG